MRRLRGKRGFHASHEASHHWKRHGMAWDANDNIVPIRQDMMAFFTGAKIELQQGSQVHHQKNTGNPRHRGIRTPGPDVIQSIAILALAKLFGLECGYHPLLG